MATRDWFDYIAGLTPSVISLAVAYIAYRQWRIARQKLRLDLYAKRFAAFEITLRLYQELLNGSGSNKDELEVVHRQFITAKIECRFLFASNSGLSALMEDMNKSAFVIKGCGEMLRVQVASEEMFSEAMSRFHSEQALLESRFQAIESAMSPYLSFRGLVD